MLLDCFAIPAAMLFSYAFLKSRFSFWHFVGVCMCVCGLGVVVLSDYMLAGEDGEGDTRTHTDTHPQAVKGDLLCLLGAGLYASSNVMQEAVVKAHDPVEFLGMCVCVCVCACVCVRECECPTISSFHFY